MNMIPVKSEAMTHIGHDGKDLHVTYRGGKTYKHAAVPAQKFNDLMAAPSKGKFMSEHVRPAYPGVQVHAKLGPQSSKQEMIAHLKGDAK